MVHRPSDSRLLNSLLSSEKEYHKQLLVLLDNYSQQSLSAFAAYASASPAHVARAVIAVAGSFAGADDALRRYAASIEAWQAELCALKDLEEDVGSIVRDREILVTRLIKLSKNQKPTRDSFIGTLGSSVGEMSQTSLNSFTSAGPSSSKLSAAQGELQACEAHLATKEKELDERRISAVRRGLEARCKAMVECGWNWGEMGKEGLRALEGIDGSGSASNGTDVSPHKHPPDSDRPPGSDLSSVGPSQSASQTHLPTSSLTVPTDKSTSSPPRVSSPAPVPPRSSSPLPPMPSSSSVTLRIPPAHSISELALPSTLERRISEEPDELGRDSSDEDSRPVEVVENARFAAANANVPRRFTFRAAHSRDNSGSNTTSSGTGTGTGSFSQPASSTLAPPNHFLSHTAPDRERKASGGFFSSIAGLFRSGGSTNSGHSGADKWKTRTESNLRAVRRTVDSDSEDETPTERTEPSSRGLFGRRASHDAPPPPSPASGQKLKKRNAREREKEKEKDQGWISDGAAVRGRDARKGSIRRRTTLPDAPPSPSPRSARMSAHARSSAVPASSSLVSVPGSSTPSPAKPTAKPKTDLRIEAIARSSTTNVSRQTSLRSSGSAPPVNRRNSGERALGLPSSHSTPGSAIGRSSPLGNHRRSRSAYTSPPSPPAHAHAHADAGRAGSSQMSLMAIVEGVTRNNRTAWERANAGLPPESAGGTSTVGGLLTVRAPPSVTKYNLRGEGGSGIAFESVRAPGSVFAAPPPAASSSPSRPSSLPPPRVPMPPTPPGAAPKIPLRSALRSQSSSPVPPLKPIVIPSAPPRVIVESDAAPAPAPARNGADRKDEESDSESVASFRTVREELTPSPPMAPTPTPPFVSTSSLAIPGKDESDVSASTISANGGGGASGESPPARRKSVRVSLQPTFSPTPPALDEDEDEVWERSGRPSLQGAANGAAHNHGDEDDHQARGKNVNGRERDFWADSSDEDEEYSKARRLLTRASRKRI